MLVNWNTINNTQCLKVTFFFSSLSTSIHEANLVVAKNNLRSIARGLHTLSEEINFSKCTIGDHKNSLGKSIWSYTKYHMK